jgi:hypothetical protein
VLDNDHSVAASDQPVELRHQLRDIGRMKTGRRLVEHVQRPTSLRALEFSG